MRWKQSLNPSLLPKTDTLPTYKIQSIIIQQVWTVTMNQSTAKIKHSSNHLCMNINKLILPFLF